MDDLERTYTPSEASTEFAFAPSLLRRYAAIYEGLGGTIPHDKRGGRLYSRTMLEHFTQARERVKAGETVEDALRTLDLAPQSAVSNVQSETDAKGVLSLLERVLETNEHLTREVVELRAAVREVRQRQLQSPRDQNTELEEQRRLNNYLLGELQRRRIEAEKVGTGKRAWWQVWKRR